MKVLGIFEPDLYFYFGLCFTSLIQSNFEQVLLKKHNLLFICKFLTEENLKMIFLGNI